MISIDPGTRALGAAWWYGPTLVGAKCTRSKETTPEGQALDHLAALRRFATDKGWSWPGPGVAVVERMEWTGGARATTVRDLLDVQAVGCIVAASAGVHVRLLAPSEWKGSIPKDVHHARFLGVLSEGELTIAQAAARSAGASHAKEVLDAIGLGLYALGRIGRHGGPRRTT